MIVQIICTTALKQQLHRLVKIGAIV